MSLTWNGDVVYDQIVAESWAGVVRAVVYSHSMMKTEINRGGWGVTGGKKTYTPSLPGQPPNKITGWLQANVAFELDEAKGIGRIGVRKNAMYGIFLELGTRKMKPRPWMLATIKKYWPQIAAQLQFKD